MAQKIYFGQLATDYIAESGRSVREIARQIPSTPDNQFSKWKWGKWETIPEEKLTKVIDVVAGKDREKRVNLMIAYLIDQTPDRYRPLIDITPKSGASEGKPELAGQRWAPDLLAKLEAMGAAYGRDEDFRILCDSLGKWAAHINEKAEQA